MAKVIYGRNPILEALKGGQDLEKLLISESAHGSKVGEIFALAKKLGIRIQKVPAQKITALTGNANSQGLAALLSEESYSTLGNILQRAHKRQEAPLVALLDGIEDPHNLGAILRSADGAGFHGVVLPNRRSVGLNATVAKVSAGAATHVPTARVSNLKNAIEDLKKENVWIVGADQSAEQSYFEADMSGALGVVIGGEGSGLHRLIKEKCDFLVRIPMFGQVNSLNASVAAALLFFEARRQRR